MRHRTPPWRTKQPDWLALLTVAAQLAGQPQALADDYVEHCRMDGNSWTGIGTEHTHAWDALRKRRRSGCGQE
ncbi:hypothetical protein [Streptomyces sp. NRRL WC-3618]|uniref:hypothetical protein n=1 Tax=Streptomyces sp. NRRL WC-3618 TaxID=1519490 RepID=UPI000ADF46E5|nr:hypothetical protein [Streptomyces sp. NRRL WC-3618]